MAIPQLDRLKTALATSGLSQRDNATFQVISQLIDYLRQTSNQLQADIATSGGGGSPLAITGLTGDVVATGPGSVPATIQPSVVTYAKIQDVSAIRLVGNPNGSAGVMVEIPLGDNLAFVDGALVVQIEPGTDGLLHRLLSLTHFDTVANSPVYGDIIYATVGPGIAGEYYGGFINGSIVEDFTGIRWGYSAGYHGAFTPSNSAGYNAPNYSFITVPLPDVNLIWSYITAYLLAPIVEDFIGIIGGYTFNPAPVVGNYPGYLRQQLSFIAVPSPAIADPLAALWTRKAIGAESQVLTVVDGIPEWEDLPPIPAEPEYPWTDITFNAADFTATGGTTPTWTVAAGNVKRWQKQQFPGVGGVGNNVRIALYLRDTTVGGTAPTQLRVALPFNIIGRFAQFISIQAAGASQTDVFVEYDDSVSTNTLFINRVGGAAFDTTASGTFLAFEISAVLAP